MSSAASEMRVFSLRKPVKPVMEKTSSEGGRCGSASSSASSSTTASSSATKSMKLQNAREGAERKYQISTGSNSNDEETDSTSNEGANEDPNSNEGATDSISSGSSDSLFSSPSVDYALKSGGSDNADWTSRKRGRGRNREKQLRMEGRRKNSTHGNSNNRNSSTRNSSNRKSNRSRRKQRNEEGGGKKKFQGANLQSPHAFREGVHLSTTRSLNRNNSSNPNSPSSPVSPISPIVPVLGGDFSGVVFPHEVSQPSEQRSPGQASQRSPQQSKQPSTPLKQQKNPTPKGSDQRTILPPPELESFHTIPGFVRDEFGSWVYVVRDKNGITARNFPTYDKKRKYKNIHFDEGMLLRINRRVSRRDGGWLLKGNVKSSGGVGASGTGDNNANGKSPGSNSNSNSPDTRSSPSGAASADSNSPSDTHSFGRGGRSWSKGSLNISSPFKSWKQRSPFRNFSAGSFAKNDVKNGPLQNNGSFPAQNDVNRDHDELAAGVRNSEIASSVGSVRSVGTSGVENSSDANQNNTLLQSSLSVDTDSSKNPNDAEKIESLKITVTSSSPSTFPGGNDFAASRGSGWLDVPSNTFESPTKKREDSLMVRDDKRHLTSHSDSRLLSKGGIGLGRVHGGGENYTRENYTNTGGSGSNRNFAGGSNNNPSGGISSSNLFGSGNGNASSGGESTGKQSNNSSGRLEGKLPRSVPRSFDEMKHEYLRTPLKRPRSAADSDSDSPDGPSPDGNSIANTITFLQVAGTPFWVFDRQIKNGRLRCNGPLKIERGQWWYRVVGSHAALLKRPTALNRKQDKVCLGSQPSTAAENAQPQDPVSPALESEPSFAAKNLERTLDQSLLELESVNQSVNLSVASPSPLATRKEHSIPNTPTTTATPTGSINKSNTTTKSNSTTALPRLTNTTTTTTTTTSPWSNTTTSPLSMTTSVAGSAGQSVLGTPMSDSSSHSSSVGGLSVVNNPNSAHGSRRNLPNVVHGGMGLAAVGGGGTGMPAGGGAASPTLSTAALVTNSDAGTALHLAAPRSNSLSGNLFNRSPKSPKKGHSNRSALLEEGSIVRVDRRFIESVPGQMSGSQTSGGQGIGNSPENSGSRNGPGNFGSPGVGRFNINSNPNTSSPGAGDTVYSYVCLAETYDLRLEKEQSVVGESVHNDGFNDGGNRKKNRDSQEQNIIGSSSSNSSSSSSSSSSIMANSIDGDGNDVNDDITTDEESGLNGLNGVWLQASKHGPAGERLYSLKPAEVEHFPTPLMAMCVRAVGLSDFPDGELKPLGLHEGERCLILMRLYASDGNVWVHVCAAENEKSEPNHTEKQGWLLEENLQIVYGGSTSPENRADIVRADKCFRDERTLDLVDDQSQQGGFLSPSPKGGHSQASPPLSSAASNAGRGGGTTNANGRGGGTTNSNANVAPLMPRNVHSPTGWDDNMDTSDGKNKNNNGNKKSDNNCPSSFAQKSEDADHNMMYTFGSPYAYPMSPQHDSEASPH